MKAVRFKLPVVKVKPVAPSKFNVLPLIAWAIVKSLPTFNVPFVEA